MSWKVMPPCPRGHDWIAAHRNGRKRTRKLELGSPQSGWARVLRRSACRNSRRNPRRASRRWRGIWPAPRCRSRWSGFAPA